MRRGEAAVPGGREKESGGGVTLRRGSPPPHPALFRPCGGMADTVALQATGSSGPSGSESRRGHSASLF